MTGKIKFLSALLAVVLTAGLVSAGQSGLQIPEQVTGLIAWEHVEHLSETIGARPTGTAGDIMTKNYIIAQFLALGYDVEVQDFSFQPWWSDEPLYSANVIATKHGKIDQTLIIGAHYDSVAVSNCDPGPFHTGAGDNASGIGVMLEAAEVLADYRTKGTIKFVAFGAEEMGLWGSFHYADQMTPTDVSNTAAMINLDSVGVGDHFNVYSGIDNPGWARDLALKIGQRMGHDIRTSPGEPSCDFLKWGEAGDWSDHVAFKELGIPIAYFEMMNWDIEPCEGEETEDYGWVMHTCMDNLSMVSIEKLEMTAEVVAALAFQISKNKLPKSKKGKIAKGNKYISIQNRN